MKSRICRLIVQFNIPMSQKTYTDDNTMHYLKWVLTVHNHSCTATIDVFIDLPVNQERNVTYQCMQCFSNPCCNNIIVHILKKQYRGTNLNMQRISCVAPSSGSLDSKFPRQRRTFRALTLNHYETVPENNALLNVTIQMIDNNKW